MRTRQLGRTDLHITPIGFGAGAAGGRLGSGWSWGPVNDEESIAAIRHALDLGINWIDTAPLYGLGHSEEVVARALKGRDERPYVFTKCSLVWNDSEEIEHVLRSQSIRREVEESLRRLKTDVIDLYQIHWPIPDAGIEEGWAALAELKAEGKVRHIGVSNFDVDQMRRCQAIAPVESLQPPYSLLHGDVEEEILPFCQREGIGVIVYSSMAAGLLGGSLAAEDVAQLPENDRRLSEPEFHEPQLSRNLALVERLRQIGAPSHRSPGQLAVAWALRHPAVTGAIVGFRRPDQVDGIVEATDIKLSQDDLTEIQSALELL